MNIKEAINLGVERLKGIPENRLAAEVLLAHCLGLRKEEIFTNQDTQIDENKEKKFFEMIARHVEGEPIAYITHKKEFYGLDFYVDSRVLIPRPETELLIDEVLKRITSLGIPRPPIETPKGINLQNPTEPAAQSIPLEILDMGTGSGCITIALSKKLPKARFMATDISEDALEVAEKNATKHNVLGRIDFVGANLLGNVNGQFDIIVANLPYIGEKKFNTVSKEVKKYEPYVALFGGDNGLQIYERLFKQICERDWRPRFLIGEFGFEQGEEMRKILNKYFPEDSIEIVKDYASIERLFVIVFSPPYHERKTPKN